MAGMMRHEVFLSNVERWRQRRNLALAELDLEWARVATRGHLTDVGLLAALHRARFDCIDMPEALRLESAAWLQAQGFKDTDNADILPVEPP